MYAPTPEHEREEVVPLGSGERKELIPENPVQKNLKILKSPSCWATF